MKNRLISLFIVFFSCTLFCQSSKLEKKVLEEIHACLASYSNDSYHLVNIKEEGLGGQSGDLVYLVKNQHNELILVIKAFITENHVKRFGNECRAITFFQQFDIDNFTPITIVFTRQTPEFDLLCMTPAPGTSVLKLMKEVNACEKGSALRKKRFERLCIAIEKVAKVLKDVHTTRQEAPCKIPSDESTWYKKFVYTVSKNIGLIDSWLPELSIKKLQASYLSLLTRCITHPSSATYVHGDAHPGNIFIDIDAGQVSFIDVACTTRYLDHNDNPQGCAANDYCHFLMSVLYIAPDYFDEHEKKTLKNIFVRMYQPHFSDHEISFYSLYWILRRLQTSLGMIKRSIREDYRFRIGQEQAKGYCKILKHEKFLGVA